MRKTFAFTLFFCALALPARNVKKPAADYSQFKNKLSKDDQVIHAIDRLTFGPRPGDVEAVQKMGLKKWIDLQLHPQRIPENPELAVKLAPLASLRMTQAETLAAYPSPQLVRAVASGRQKPPDDPIARAAVERQVRRFNIKKGQDENAPMEPAVPLDDLLTRDQIRTMRNGKDEQKREVLAAIPEEKIDDVVVAMPGGMRNQLMPVANPVVRRKLLLANQPQQLVFYDLAEAKLYRAILSNRQLEEELVDFWYNHFNVYIDKGADRFLVPSYERDAIRPHVLGKFRDLLEATATSPAMMFYLDNWESVAEQVKRPNAKAPRRGLNENYAREVMELHTLGVDGGQTQKDITEVARCFTGWTIRNPNQGGDFYYNDKVHDKSEKIVLGVKIAAGGGREDGEKVLDILANHPSTARFISKKLAQRFVADDPPPELIGRMAKTFTKTHGDMREVMKTMLESKEFFSAGAYRAKVKTPLDVIASAIRATGAQVDYAFPLAQRLGQLGEPLYRKVEPTGYSNENAEWISSASLLGRMNFALALVQNKQPGVRLDASHFTGDTETTAASVLFTLPTEQTRAAIEQALASQRAKDPKAATPALVAGLALGSPDFQRR
jgi:uncharacterized protein (DUF1800 family)